MRNARGKSALPAALLALLLSCGEPSHPTASPPAPMGRSEAWADSEAAESEAGGRDEENDGGDVPHAAPDASADGAKPRSFGSAAWVEFRRRRAPDARVTSVDGGALPADASLGAQNPAEEVLGADEPELLDPWRYAGVRRVDAPGCSDAPISEDTPQWFIVSCAISELVLVCPEFARVCLAEDTVCGDGCEQLAELLLSLGG